MRAQCSNQPLISGVLFFGHTTVSSSEKPFFSFLGQPSTSSQWQAAISNVCFFNPMYSAACCCSMSFTVDRGYVFGSVIMAMCWTAAVASPGLSSARKADAQDNLRLAILTCKIICLLAKMHLRCFGRRLPKSISFAILLHN